jgi:hypothetical protein
MNASLIHGIIGVLTIMSNDVFQYFRHDWTSALPGIARTVSILTVQAG